MAYPDFLRKAQAGHELNDSVSCMIQTKKEVDINQPQTLWVTICLGGRLENVLLNTLVLQSLYKTLHTVKGMLKSASEPEKHTKRQPTFYGLRVPSSAS